MVFHWIVLFSGLRAGVIDYVLTPLAQWGGIKKKKDLTRFSEQAWLLIYYTFFIPIGLVRYNHSEGRRSTLEEQAEEWL